MRGEVIVGRCNPGHQRVKLPGDDGGVLDVADRRSRIGQIVVVSIELIGFDIFLERNQRHRAGKLFAAQPDQIDLERQHGMERVMYSFHEPLKLLSNSS